MGPVTGKYNALRYGCHCSRGGVSGTPFLSASANGYANTNWYFDDAGGYNLHGLEALQGVMSNGVPSSAIDYSSTSHIYGGTNVVGYYSKGSDGGLGLYFSDNIIFKGQSSWYLISTIDSYNGVRYGYDTFINWFSASAFGGTDYSNTPIGAVTTNDEPGESGKNNNFIYFGLWAAGKNFAICAWESRTWLYSQATGDPFVTR